VEKGGKANGKISKMRNFLLTLSFLSKIELSNLRQEFK